MKRLETESGARATDSDTHVWNVWISQREAEREHRGGETSPLRPFLIYGEVASVTSPRHCKDTAKPFCFCFGQSTLQVMLCKVAWRSR